MLLSDHSGGNNFNFLQTRGFHTVAVSNNRRKFLKSLHGAQKLQTEGSFVDFLNILLYISVLTTLAKPFS